MNKLDSFDKALRDSLENYEVEYDPSQWSQLESRMRSTYNYIWLAVASVIAILTSVFVYNMINTEVKNSPEPVVVNVAGPVVSDPAEIKLPVNNKENPGIIESHTEEIIQDEPSQSKISEPALESVNNNIISNDNIQNNYSGNKLNNNTDNNSNVPVPVRNNKVEELTLPDPVFVLPKAVYCQNEDISLVALNLPEDAIAEWKLSNGMVLNGKSAVVSFDYPGTYRIKLKYISEKAKPVKAEQVIEILPAPESHFSWEEVIDNGRPYVLFHNESATDKINWIFEDGSVSKEKDPKRFYRYKGDFPVTLEASSAEGCKTVTQKIITVNDEYKLWAPNSFSPNGDGNNDYFIPEALLISDAVFTMNIYDRSGKLVYSTTSANRPWDGRFMNDNQQAPEGVYVWYVLIKGEQPYGGHVTIVK